MSPDTGEIRPIGAATLATDHPLFESYNRLLLDDGRIAIPDADLSRVKRMNRADRRAWAKRQTRP